MGRKKQKGLARSYRIIRAQLKEKGVKCNRKMTELVIEHSELYNVDLNPFLPLGKSNSQKYALHVLKINNGYVIPITKRKKKVDYKKQYYKYLASPQWASIRRDIIEDRKRCERCSSNKELQVHHKTYKNVFNEKMEDLELLCRKCHREEHDLI